MTRVIALYWLDRRGGVDIWFGGPPKAGRPANTVQVVTADRPTKCGEVIEGQQARPLRDPYRAADGMVLVVGIPVQP